jgi:hypothetical protein
VPVAQVALRVAPPPTVIVVVAGVTVHPLRAGIVVVDRTGTLRE